MRHTHDNPYQARFDARARVALLGLALLLSACGGGSGDTGRAPTPSVGNIQCDVPGRNNWLYANMLDYYLFYDQVPSVNAADYASPQALLADLRFQERDPFSFISDAARESLAFDEGREFGLGYSWSLDDDDVSRITRVVDASPFGLAGIERGDIIVSVDDIPWFNLTQAYFEERVLGTPEQPGNAVWRIVDRDSGDARTVRVMAAEYGINTVLKEQVITLAESGTRVGYLAFSTFLDTSADELENAILDFGNAGIDELVLDLRYNRGGRLSVAEFLASMVAGNANADQLLYLYRHNDKYQENNFALSLRTTVSELDLSRVIVLTSGNTASASEVVIGGLQPYLDVVTLGSTSSGKPYAQRGRDNSCGDRLNAVESEGVNADGVSVFGGVAATCAASDDITRDFGRNTVTGQSEGMLQAGLDYIAAGRCDTLPTAAQDSRQRLPASGKGQRQGTLSIGGAVY